MKYLCLCYYDAAGFAAMSDEQRAELGPLCEPHDKALRDSGHLIMNASLGMPEDSRVILGPDRRRAGPYVETGEPLGAFFIIEADDMAQAEKIAALHPGAHLGHLFGGGIEVRPIAFSIEP